MSAIDPNLIFIFFGVFSVRGIFGRNLGFFFHFGLGMGALHCNYNDSVDVVHMISPSAILRM